MSRTVPENHGGEGEPEAGPDLVRRRAAKIIIDAMLEDPDHEGDEDKEAARCGPKIPSQGLQEHPSVLHLHAFDWHNHGHTRFCVRQSEVHIFGPI